MVNLLGPALLVVVAAAVLRLGLRNRPDWSRAVGIVLLVAIVVAAVAFVDGMRYACCVD